MDTDDGDGIGRRLLVVAMAMEELEVVVPVESASAYRHDMVDFPHVLPPEGQAAPPAPPVLALEQRCHAR